MRPEKSKLLMEIFPKAFEDTHKEEPFALFGFECDDGWFDLLKEALEKIKAYIDSKESVTFNVTQIKEKFGTLRFYYDAIVPGDNPIDSIIDAAEIRSAKECERCGAPASTKRRGCWFYTSCDDCDTPTVS